MKGVLRSAGLAVVPVMAILLSLFVGIYDIGINEVFFTLFHPGTPGTLSTVVWKLRFPRTLAAAFSGAALAASGAAFQGVFRNPLVNSGILGVSSGAGLGACIAIVFLGGGSATYLLAFSFAILAVVLAYFAGRINHVTSTISLILGGVIVSSLFRALISVMKFLADPYAELPTITFWLMGSFADINFTHFWAFLPMTLGILGIFLSRWRINALSMGMKEAESLGLNTKLYSILVIGGATLATSSAVCISGTIGWVGLIIPHICRMLFGNDNRILVPASISLGATFLVLMDILARNITAAELPIGILCSVIGAPFFIYLLKKTKGGGWQ